MSLLLTITAKPTSERRNNYLHRHSGLLSAIQSQPVTWYNGQCLDCCSMSSFI